MKTTTAFNSGGQLKKGTKVGDFIYKNIKDKYEIIYIHELNEVIQVRHTETGKEEWIVCNSYAIEEK